MPFLHMCQVSYLSHLAIGTLEMELKLFFFFSLVFQGKFKQHA